MIGTLLRTTVIGPRQAVRVPGWVSDLASFRRWALSDEVPEKTRLSYFRGEVWVDLTMEQLFWHNRLKTVVTAALENLVTAGDLGEFFSDGVRLSNVEADLSTEPDALFVSYGSLERHRARLV